MNIVLDVQVIHFEVEDTVIQTELRVIDILWLQVNVTLFIMVLVVVADAIVQLTERRTVDPAAEIKVQLHFSERRRK